MAGMAGFEPANTGVKVLCLTTWRHPIKIRSGSDLLSHKATLAIPSALEDLTAVFDMGTGVTPPQLPPENFFQLHFQNCTMLIIIYLSRSNPRSISTSQLKTLLSLHLWPIYLVVFQGSY